MRAWLQRTLARRAQNKVDGSRSFQMSLDWLRLAIAAAAHQRRDPDEALEQFTQWRPAAVQEYARKYYTDELNRVLLTGMVISSYCHNVVKHAVQFTNRQRGEV